MASRKIFRVQLGGRLSLVSKPQPGQGPARDRLPASVRRYGGGPRQTGCGAGLGIKMSESSRRKARPGDPEGAARGVRRGPETDGVRGWTWHKNVRVHFQPEEARPVYASRGGGLWPVSRATSPLDLAQSSPGPPSGWLAGVSRARRQPLEATPYGPRKGQSRGALRVRPPRTA